MKNLMTVLYYTANREQPEFEEKIIANLLEQCDDLPIISVSQKPISLGKNICVGDVGFSGYNEWRQILIGARLAKTPYIVFAESDFLYPHEYFTFVPPKKGLYRYDNIRIVYKDARIAGSYRKKIYSEGAQIADRDLVIRVFEQFFEGRPMWINENDAATAYADGKYLLIENLPFEFFSGKIACVSFKTEYGLDKYTGTLNGPGQGNRKITLPYWGHVNTLRAKYFPKMALKTIVTKIPSREGFLWGKETLAVGYPWLTYGAIIALEAIVSKKMKVLEFGGGGSTIFWARNCQSVKTYETNLEWHAKIMQQVADLGLKNVELLYCDRRQTRLGLESEPDNYYDIVLIDSDPRRSTRFNLANRSMAKIKTSGWLVIDNYLKFGMSDFDYSGWKVYTFDELDYRGQGTRLCQKLPNQIL